MSRPPGEGEWTTVQGEVVIDTKQDKGKVVLGEGVAPSLTKGRAVFRLAKDGKEVQCQLARGQEVGRVRVSQADAEVLDLGANVCSSQVRRRRFDDGLRNLRSLSLLVAAVPALAAVLAIVPGLLFPRPSGNDAAQLSAVWQRAAFDLAGPPGAPGGLLGALTKPLDGVKPSKRVAQAEAAGREATAEIALARRQAGATETTWFTGDGDYSTPALADLYGDGKTDIVNGGGQVAGITYGIHFTQGGYVRVLSPTGNAGTKSPAGGLKCEYKPDQSVDSSAAVGRFLPGGAWGIAVGTGDYFPDASDTDVVLAVRSNCTLAWSARLDSSTYSSPALADLDGNGALRVVEGTNNGHGGGSVWALAGTNGSVLWCQALDGEVIGSVVTAYLGGGYQDVIVASTGGAQVLDGRTGHVITTLERGVGLQNSALVTDDPNGTIGITLAGYNAYDKGEVEHYELLGSDGAHVDGPGSWPMFHHDPRLTGNAETALTP